MLNICDFGLSRIKNESVIKISGMLGTLRMVSMYTHTHTHAHTHTHTHVHTCILYTHADTRTHTHAHTHAHAHTQPQPQSRSPRTSSHPTRSAVYRAPFFVLQNLSKSTQAHDAQAVSAMFQHPMITSAGAGPIQLVYGSPPLLPPRCSPRRRTMKNICFRHSSLEFPKRSRLE